MSKGLPKADKLLRSNWQPIYDSVGQKKKAISELKNWYKKGVLDDLFEEEVRESTKVKK